MDARRATPLISLVLLAGCSGLPAAVAGGPSSAPRATGIVVADGHGWTTTGLDGQIPAPVSCHIRTATDGEPLPDPTCIPGAIDTAVTGTNTSTMICRKGGYTSSVRPPQSLTEPAKKKLTGGWATHW